MVTLSDLGVTLNVAVLDLVNKVITTPDNNSPRSVMACISWSTWATQP